MRTLYPYGVVESGSAQPGAVTATVDAEPRQATVNHHSATHLMHQPSLMLGDHVEQQGSKVEPGQLRFDFNHDQAVGAQQIAANRIMGK